ncbi:Tad domain-containing protein [Roseovarius sp. A-2]|uniref:Tad domain-containing protein n=1 Tax=Roseovarius sp. A-2 TaxID=1570360 RepID=UPI0009B577AA|nr:Tad domain-containing protein [Roseovarius sp. A-2]
MLKAGTALASRPFRQFLHEEDGTVTALAFFMVLIMLMVGGFALDTMHHERERASLQATLDRAVLAGASASSDAEARQIVEDYFAKAGKADYLLAEREGDIATSLNSATITARAQRNISTYLMKLSGVDTLGVAAASTAEVRIPNLEGILVLDVSGSMGSNSKIDNLKVAAKQFVSTVVGNSDPGSAVLSIVPFSFSVSPPESIFEALAVDETHNYSTCLEFKDNDYDHATLTSGSSSLSSGIPAQQMVYTSVYGGFDDLTQSWRSCYNNDYMRILPYSTSVADLHAKIDALQPDGNTSGNEGMNWGAALLDPTFREVTAHMIDNDRLDDSLAHVPANYNDPETLKVIIFMGDGANTTSYFFDRSPARFRGSNSDLYEVIYQDREFKYAYNVYNVDWKKYGWDGERRCDYSNWECEYEESGPEESVYYLYSPVYGQYYSIAENDWLSPSEFNNLEDTIEGYVSTNQLSWETAWGLMSVDYYSSKTQNWSAWNDYTGSEYINGSQKNVLMQQVCKATKDEHVVVYTIGFEVSRNGTAERELIKCATSPSHYYRASGTDISSAFSSIAANVKHLRLTQ